MKIGYAALTKGIPNTDFKSLRLQDLDREKFENILSHNLKSLDNIIDYNIKNNINHFRISSDIVPFGSHEKMVFDWQNTFKDILNSIGEKIDQGDIRISMHPGQYTVLNSKDNGVVKRAIKDLRYHTDFLNSLNRNSQNKIILHIGGVYGDKESAIERFCVNYRELDEDIKSRLIIENDDVSYGFNEVLNIGLEEKIPVVYDNLHNSINNDNYKSDRENILLSSKTWESSDGIPKIHYSQQAEGKRVGSHSDTIDLEIFKEFHNSIKDLNIDIMLEVKDKNLSTVKVNNLLYENSINILEDEWAKYKYLILEHSPSIYEEIRGLLKDKSNYPVLEFYRLIDRALEEEVQYGRSINSLDHVYGYFKNLDSKEIKKYNRYILQYEKGNYTINPIKKYIYLLAEKYELTYLLNSYYFFM